MVLVVVASLMVFFPDATALDDIELLTMRDAVVAVGGDWEAIEELLATLSPEDRELVMATYPDRITELEQVRRAIEESGADWEAGLNSVSILPPELRPGTGWLPISAKEGGLSREVVRIAAREDGPAAMTLPESWDWRSVGGADWTTPIKDQEECGSCWAFGPLAAIESRVKLAADNPQLVPDFSEQYLLSCSPGSCEGWYMDTTSDWIFCEGTVDEACFPYVAQDTVACSESCFDRNSRKYKGEGWFWVSGGYDIIDEDRIKHEIFSGGPVVAAMDVYTDFRSYNGGVYQYATGQYEGGHCIAIVGWGKEGSTDYWICKNSWSPYWGEAGWFKIKMGEVNIGIEAVAYLPKVRGRVLFYEGHVPWEDFELLKRYTEWGNRLASNGYLIHSSATSPLTSDLLSCYDVVIISNPTTSFTAAELAAIKEFVGRGRIIASGDGDLFDSEFIYRQDNVKAAVQYVDWLATGDGGGLMVMGERALSNAAANQVANLFGLKINSDIIHDPKRYEADTFWPILGPKEDVLVPASASLAISKDAFPLARTTSSGYVTAGVASSEAASSEAAEVAVTPEEIELSVMSADEDAIALDVESAGYEILPEDMPPAGDLSPEGELATAPAEEAGMEVSSDPVPMAGLSFTGPIVIAAIDFGRKGEDTVGIFRNGGWHLDYENDAIPDKVFGYGTGTDIPITGDWSGDGKDTVGIFRNGGWHLDYDNNGIPDETFGFGVGTDVPITGDWNGDGRDSVGLFRDGIWILDYDNNGIPDKIFGFGISTDIPITGDWNGDGKDTAGIFRNGGWHLDFDNDGIPNKIFGFGIGTDVPIIGDWNGDGKDSVGLFRDGLWILDYDNDGIPDKVFNYGLSTDIPVVGDWYKN